MAFTEEPLGFAGSHTAFVDDDNMVAEVRKATRVVRVFNGESAWSDAVREAEDLNVAERANH